MGKYSQITEKRARTGYLLDSGTNPVTFVFGFLNQLISVSPILKGSVIVQMFRTGVRK